MRRVRSAMGLVFCLLGAVALTSCLVPHHRSHRTYVAHYRHPAPPGHHGHLPPGHRKKAAHVHGHGCGHVWRDGRWVTVEIEIGR